MGFKMKTPSITKGTKGHREAVKNIKLNRSMDKTSLPDSRPGSSAFQHKATGEKNKFHNQAHDSGFMDSNHKTPYERDTSPAKDIDDRIARLTERKAAKAARQSDRATRKTARLTERADVQTAKAGVAEAKDKFVKRGRKLAKAEKLRAKAAHYTPPVAPVDEGKTEKVSEDATRKIVKKVDKKDENVNTGVTSSIDRAKYVGKDKLPTYKESFTDAVAAKYKDKGGYDQYVKDAEAWWAKQKSPAKNYKNPQDYKVFNYGNKPTPVKNKSKKY